MSDTKNRRTAQRLFVQHGAERERRAIIADLRAEAEAPGAQTAWPYGGSIGEVLLAVATRIEDGSK